MIGILALFSEAAVCLPDNKTHACVLNTAFVIDPEPSTMNPRSIEQLTACMMSPVGQAPQAKIAIE
jgi:hypothetical protein